MRRSVVCLLVTGVLVAVSAPLAGGQTSGLWAEIRRTEYGIPHILANDWQSLGFGTGYAFAQDNICTIAETYVTVDGERSRFFGPDGSYVQEALGIRVNNLDSDLFFRQIIDSHVIDRMLAELPPLGPEPAVLQDVQGYAEGYNRYLSDVGGSSGVPDPRCQGQPWVRSITVDDVYRRFYQLILLAGYDVVIPGIAEASPPPPGGTTAAFDPQSAAGAIAANWSKVRARLGSNAVAVGSAGTSNGAGLLLGNPHFPWHGPERFYQMQLTIPGQVNVTGVGLYGVPAINIGHTATVAWSHTVSTAFRFTPYQLTLVPGDPTSYLLDGQPVAMDPRPVSVQALQPDGSLQTVTRTLWWTRYGPVFTDLVGVPLPWTETTAFAIRDVNAENFGRVLNHFFDVDRARTVGDVLKILKEYQGIPWVNTIAADKWGQALYADLGAIPHVTNDQAQQCDTPAGQATFAAIGLPILDGSRTACDWGTDPDSVVPGIFGPSEEPSLLRKDYVTNSNDSYWLSNPKHPLEGFPRIIGQERTARTLRTRNGLVMVGTLADRRAFTRQAMQDLVFSDWSYAALITKDDLVTMCRQFAAVGAVPTSTGAPVAPGNACDVLANWDGRENLDSRGALLFRRFWDYASQAEPTPFSHPFDVTHPVTTPYGLDTTNPQVQTALGDAIQDFRDAGLPLDTPVGDQQAITWSGVRIPIHGGTGDPHGDFNAIWTTWVPGQGLSEVTGGSSFVQVVTWGSGSCPDTRTILTYSESENPDSPHHYDQTLLFSQKQWLLDRFCESQISASPALQTTVIQR